MFPFAAKSVRQAVRLAMVICALSGVALAADDPYGSDPLQSMQWIELKRQYLGADAKVEFDPRVQVRGPKFADDPMNVPVSVAVAELTDVEQIIVMVDRNPIRKVLDFQPKAGTRAAISFRFKLEQASPVRAAARTRDGVWHVGGTLVESSGGGCTVAGATRQDGSWVKTLGQVSGRVFDGLDGSGSRLRLRVMHPMDTGLVGGIPAFYLKNVELLDARGTELLKLSTFEPISENPVFSFDFATRPAGPVRVTGVDNNGNRVEGQL